MTGQASAPFTVEAVFEDGRRERGSFDDEASALSAFDAHRQAPDLMSVQFIGPGRVSGFYPGKPHPTSGQ